MRLRPAPHDGRPARGCVSKATPHNQGGFARGELTAVQSASYPTILAWQKVRGPCPPGDRSPTGSASSRRAMPPRPSRCGSAYFRRLVGLARQRLRARAAAGRRRGGRGPRAPSTASAAAPSRAASPGWSDRDDLWQLLVVLTARKASRPGAAPSAGRSAAAGEVLGEAALAGAGRRRRGAGLEQVLGPEPTPAFAAQVAEECRRLLDGLGDDRLRRGRGLEDGRLHQRGDRRQARLRPAARSSASSS